MNSQDIRYGKPVRHGFVTWSEALRRNAERARSDDPGTRCILYATEAEAIADVLDEQARIFSAALDLVLYCYTTGATFPSPIGVTLLEALRDALQRDIDPS